uniref:Uncharacterized protein n=1 Tax=Syphacia muris TaxID=451379 RepID=A0A0N5AQY4_9BILA
MLMLDTSKSSDAAPNTDVNQRTVQETNEVGVSTGVTTETAAAAATAAIIKVILLLLLVTVKCLVYQVALRVADATLRRW